MQLPTLAKVMHFPLGQVAGPGNSLAGPIQTLCLLFLSSPWLSSCNTPNQGNQEMPGKAEISML